MNNGNNGEYISRITFIYSHVYLLRFLFVFSCVVHTRGRYMIYDTRYIK